MELKEIAVLGSTGSIGQQTLAVVDWFPEAYHVSVLAAGSRLEDLAAQAQKYRPHLVVAAEKSAYPALKAALPDFSGEILCGEEGLFAAATYPVDIIVHGIAGMAGLQPLLWALEKGRTIAIANKESLVTAGHLVTALIKEKNGVLLPVDSEHSAIFQCLLGGRSGLDKIILTASGGPFRTFTSEEMEQITPAMALRHPTWSMGAKVTVDSSTMMNKGLEVMEAHWLFDVEYDKIDVLIQPQSLVHSIVSFGDGSFLAHMGQADMRIPIQFALSYPDRKFNPLPPLDFAQVGQIEFFAPDREKFPLLDLAYAAGRAGGTLPAVLNTANEILVYMFLEERIKYKDIFYYVEKALAAHSNLGNPDMEAILSAQDWAKAYLKEVIKCY